MLVQSVNSNNVVTYSVVNHDPNVASIMTWKTNLYRGVLASVGADGYTNINENAPISLVKEIAKLIKW